MRLRLRLERNELPAVSVVWPIRDALGKQNVAQLLACINERFPLEGNTWGLEDYVVTIGGYEILHYHEVGSVCKEEDEIVVRPLSYAELRARTITGRAQITPDGRHLVDGIPFGRPLLKKPARPDVQIPPRKRQLQLDSEEDAQRLISEHGADDSDDSDDSDDDGDAEDADFLPDQDEDEMDTSHATSGAPRALMSGPSSTSPSDRNLRKRKRSVSFLGNTETPSAKSQSAEGDSASADHTSSEDCDETSTDDSTSESSEESSSADDSDSDSSDSASTNEGSQNESSAEEKPTASISAVPRRHRASDNDTLQDAQQASELRSAGLPGSGAPNTKARNRRRVESKKLARAKESGHLPPNATLEDFREWDSNRQKSQQAALAESDPAAARSSVTGYSLDTVNAGSPVHTSQEVRTPTATITSNAAGETSGAQMESERQRLLDEIASGGIDVGAHHVTSRAKSKPTGHVDNGSVEIAESPESAQSVAKKRRLDVASSTRLLFGHLGHRAPKSRAEREQLQEKMEESSRRAAVTRPSIVPTTTEDDVAQAKDPEAWRDKLSILAVECCDEGVTLSAPPFPFKQRWDPQYSSKKHKRNSALYSNARSKKRKIAAGNGAPAYVETYDKYNTDGQGDALNYDDPDDDGGDDEDWEEGALLDGDGSHEDDQDQADMQLLAEVAANEQGKDDFPPLPTDVSTLADLDAHDARTGDFVVFTELDCSAATGWQPSMVTRSALLQSKEGDAWTIKLASRDLPRKKFDDEGNRVYERFEVAVDDGDMDEGVRTLTWSDMLGPKLLLRPEAESPADS